MSLPHFFQEKEMINNLTHLKGSLVATMAKNYEGGPLICRLLRENFSTNELKILKKHPDLIQRISNISQLKTGPLKMYLENNYGLEIGEFAAPDSDDTDFFIGIEGLQERMPTFDKVKRGGWYVAEKDFVFWAQSFIMSQIRMNVIIRYIEYKRTKKTFTTT